MAVSRNNIAYLADGPAGRGYAFSPDGLYPPGAAGSSAAGELVLTFGQAESSQVAPPPFVMDGITVIQQTGSDSNRVGIVFLGDGYTASQIDTDYRQHVDSLVAYMFTGGILSEPFNRYHNFFNVYAINIISNQSGADNPPTQSYVDTALNGTYYFDGVTERLLSIDFSLGISALDQALAGTTIRTDIRFVTVNSTIYGGAGGYFSVYAGGNQFSHEVALHELGHSFAFLADEYQAAGTGGNGGSHYSGLEPGEPNVTISPTGQKWAHWLGYNQEGVGVIGAFEGGRYYTTGIYRPSQSSKMRDLGTPFDAIAREQFILRIYQLVDPIDSATEGFDLTDVAGLTVTVIDPAVIKLRWSIDGKVLTDGTVATLNFASYNTPSGTHLVEAFAYDPTDWVRLDRSSLEQTKIWSVTLNHAVLRSDGVNPLVGGNLSDTLIASAKPDSLSGGAGTDTLSYVLSTAAVTVNLAANTASGGHAAGDSISAFENVTGSAHNDVLTGSGEANLLEGGAGNDRLDGGAGADQLVGGTGNDLYFVDSGDVIVEGVNAGTDEVRTALAAYTLAANVETLTGTSASGQSLTGNGLANRLTGGAGDDRLDGGAGADQLAGGLGNDVYLVEHPGDVVTDTGGLDEVRTAMADTTAAAGVELLTGLLNTGQVLRGNSLDNVVSGGAGADKMVGGLGNDLYLVGAGDNVIEKAGEGTDEVRTALAAYTLTAEVERLTGLAATGQTLTGNALANTITGGPGNDLINGGLGADNLAGGLGNDVYTVDAGDVVTEAANAGSDEVRTALAAYTLAANVEKLIGTAATGQALTGNALANSLIGGAGADTLDGGAGADSLAGGLGNDVYVVAAGDTVIEAVNGGYDEIRTALATYTLGANLEAATGISATGQTLTGNSLANRLNGGAGNDRLDGGLGADILAGGAGNDSYFVGSSTDAVIEGASEGTGDRIYASVSYTLAEGVHVEILSTAADAGTAPLILAGNGLDNRIIGNAGHNTLYGMGGTDRLEGLGGDDSYVVDSALDVVVETAGRGYDTVFASVSYTLGAGQAIEALSTVDRSGTAAINLTGNALANALYGNAGANRLSGGDGGDWLDGGDGDDRLEGGAGIDTASYANAAAGVTLSLALTVAQASGGAGSETLIDVENLTGSAHADTLTGNGLANLLDGGGGADILRGGAGNDVYAVDQAGDSIDELAGQGTDEVRTALASYSLAALANVENLTGTSATGQILTGNSAGNRISGGSGHDTLALWVGGGNDTALGGAGNDMFLFGATLNPGDTIRGGAGTDTIVIQGDYAGGLTLGANVSEIEAINIHPGTNTSFGRGGTDRFSYSITTSDSNFAAGVQAKVNASLLFPNEALVFNGAAESDASFLITSGRAADTLTGGLGNDVFYGNLGADQLTGGGGGDSFRYLGTAESTAAAMDRILDFTPGTDRIELDRIDADSHAAGDQAFEWIGSAAFGGTGAGSAGELRAFEAGGTWFVEGDVNGDGVADLVIALTLQGPVPLGAGDFLL